MSGGSIWLEWPNAGLGVRYRIYARPAGASGYRLLRTTRTAGVTVKGLARGMTYEIRVVPVNMRGHTGPWAETTVKVS